MKHTLPVFLIYIAGITGVSAQYNADSAYVERERKLLDAVVYDYHLVKWGMFNMFAQDLDLVYERRVNLNFSYVFELDWNYGPYRGRYGFYPGLRYYYNLEERILRRYEKKGIKTSCMSGNYFEADLGFENRHGSDYSEYGLKGSFFAPTFKIGMQRRIKRHLFFDTWFGYQLPLPDPRPVDDRIIQVGNIRFGFLFGIALDPTHKPRHEM